MGRDRVLSLRLSYQTIAHCYGLQIAAGRNVKGIPVGTIVGDTVTAVIEASRRMYEIVPLDEEKAMEFILKYADAIPGYDAVEPDWSVVKERQHQRPATESKNRPEQHSAEQTTPEPANHPLEPESKAEANLSAEEYLENGQEPQGIVEVAIPSVSVDVEKAIEQAAHEELEKDSEALAIGVRLFEVERPVVAHINPKCPWTATPVIPIEDIPVDDILYKEAISIDPLMALAVRSVYWVIRRDEFSSEFAAKLAKKTYSNWMKWREQYGEPKS